MNRPWKGYGKSFGKWGKNPAAVTAFPSGRSTQTSLVLDREAVDEVLKRHGKSFWKRAIHPAMGMRNIPFIKK
jgi:hypothetical protein